MALGHFRQHMREQCERGPRHGEYFPRPVVCNNLQREPVVRSQIRGKLTAGLPRTGLLACRRLSECNRIIRKCCHSREFLWWCASLCLSSEMTLYMKKPKQSKHSKIFDRGVLGQTHENR